MKEKQYNKEKIVLDITDTILNLLLLFLFILTGLSKSTVHFIEQYTNNSYYILLLFVIITGIGFSIITFPLDFYSSYLLEHKYKLSNQTLGKWVIEKAKMLLVGSVIGLPILLLFYYLLATFGSLWWLLFGIGMFIISVVLSQIIPVFIMPLFYKIEPFEDAELTERINKLAKDAGLNLKAIFKFDMSKNTKKANAAFTGIGKTKRIILGDTLLQNFDKDEIETVIAHEMGHYKIKHIVKNMIFGTITSFGIFYILSVLYSHSLNWFGFSAITDIGALPILALWGMLINIIESPLSNYISRKYEYQADTYAVEQTNKHTQFITALNKLNEQNLGDKDPHPFIEWYYYSHPSIKRRIENIERLMHKKS